MKKSKIWMPILGVVGTAAAVAPLVCMTACSSAIKLELSDTGKDFSLSGTFEKGSKYEFTIDLSKWTTDKPATPWTDKTFAIRISSNDLTQEDYIDLLSASATMNGAALNIVQTKVQDKKFWFVFADGAITSDTAKITFTVKCKDKFTGKVWFLLPQ